MLARNKYVAITMNVGRYINGFPNSSQAAEIGCYYDAKSNTLPELPATVVPNSGIFFVETSCHSAPGVHLSPRQVCTAAYLSTSFTGISWILKNIL